MIGYGILLIAQISLLNKEGIIILFLNIILKGKGVVLAQSHASHVIFKFMAIICEGCAKETSLLCLRL